jgi:hypothetical protein
LVIGLIQNAYHTYFTQFDANNTPIQSSYMRVWGTFLIVAGPIGATGPDGITDHSFTNIQTLAKNFASVQTGDGIDPIGLDPHFPGLHNVVREGDPNADSVRQAFDFYSPDTFNYATLNLGACPTLTASIYGINSYAQNTFPQPSVAGLVRQILSFQVDGDITPPTVHSITASPSALWPPNNKMVPVTLSVTATDACGIAGAKIVSVTSNEPQDGKEPDWQITGDLSLLLRAQRDGSGSGRIYTIAVEVTDPAGNQTRGTTTVVVPHDQS